MPFRSGFRRPRALVPLVAAVIAGACVSNSPVCVADPAGAVAAAMTSARAGTKCPPLRHNATVQQAAEVFNKLSDDYLNHTATRIPAGKEAPGDKIDPMPGLKTLGYPGKKAILLQGANQAETLAIKGALLEGAASQAFSDCSYTEFGAATVRNERTGYALVALLLAAAP